MNGEPKTTQLAEAQKSIQTKIKKPVTKKKEEETEVEMTPNAIEMALTDAKSLPVATCRGFYGKEHPELMPVRREAGRRIGAMVQDGYPPLVRVKRKIKDSTVGTIVGAVFTGAVAVVVGWFAYDKYQAYKSENEGL